MLDYETIVEVLTETIKDQKTTIFLKDYKINELEKKIKGLELKIDTYNAQIETQI